MKFFTVLRFAVKRPPTKPDPPTWHDFCRQVPRFFYTLRYNRKTVKKTTKSLKIKGLVFYGILYGCFTVALRFLALLLKTCYTKHQTHPPYPLLSTLPLTHPALQNRWKSSIWVMFEKCWKLRSLELLQSHCKGTAKDAAKQQTVENQALAKILCSFAVLCKNYPSDPPDPLGTIFAGKNFVFSIHFFFTAKLQNWKLKTRKSIERVALESFAASFAVALQFLCSFLHFLKNYVITKHPPTTPPLAQI